jgi:hypothetical protein
MVQIKIPLLCALLPILTLYRCWQEGGAFCPTPWILCSNLFWRETVQCMKHILGWTLRFPHNSHSGKNMQCGLCRFLDNFTLLNWWHSTDAVKHRLENCACERCCIALYNKWRLWTAENGCNCSVHLKATGMRTTWVLTWFYSQLFFPAKFSEQVGLHSCCESFLHIYFEMPIAPFWLELEEVLYVEQYYLGEASLCKMWYMI